MSSFVPKSKYFRDMERYGEMRKFTKEELAWMAAAAIIAECQRMARLGATVSRTVKGR